MVEIPASYVANHLGNFDYNYNKAYYGLGLALPPKRYCTDIFISQILGAFKLAYRQDEISSREIPNFDELKLCTLFDSLRNNREVMRYFPDVGPNSYPKPKKWVVKVLGTMSPGYLDFLVEHALDQRKQAESVIIQEEGYLNEVLQSNWLPNKSGKRFHQPKLETLVNSYKPRSTTKYEPPTGDQIRVKFNEGFSMRLSVENLEREEQIKRNFGRTNFGTSI